MVARPVARPQPPRRASLPALLRDDRRLLRVKFLVVLVCALVAALVERP